MSTILLRGIVVEVALVFNGDIDDQKKREANEKTREKNDKAIQHNVDRISAAQNNPNWTEEKRNREIAKYQQRINDLREAKKKTKMPKDNLVVATFAYPRSGHSSVMTTRPLDIPSNEDTPVTPEQNFFDAGLFKEEIQGETELQVSITDKDKASGFLNFLRSVLSSALNAVAGDAIGGISEVLVSQTAAETSNLVEKAIKGDGKDRIETVAQSKKVRLRIDDAGDFEILNTSDDISIDGDRLRLVLRTPKRLTVAYEKSSVKAAEPVPLEKGALNGYVILQLTATSS